MSKIDWTQFNEKQIQAIDMPSLPNRGGLGFDEMVLCQEYGHEIRAFASNFQ